MFEVKNCPVGHYFNVFGRDTDRLCCYRFVDYCYKCQDCSLKNFLRLEDNVRFNNYFGVLEVSDVIGYENSNNS